MKTAANIVLLINPEFYYPVNYTIRQDGVKVHEKTKLQGRDLTEPQIVELINSGYFAQFSQQQINNPIIAEKELSANTDSVEQAFKKWWKSKHEVPHSLTERMKMAFLAGSKVKPVNEKQVQALKAEIGKVYGTHQSYLEICNIIDRHLSTAPDDGWIPVEKAKLEDCKFYWICNKDGEVESAMWLEEEKIFDQEEWHYRLDEVTHISEIKKPVAPKSPR